MSDLQYQTLDELHKSKRQCNKYIRNLKDKVSGQSERLKWINKYIDEKSDTKTLAELRKLTDDQRLEVFNKFCKGCGKEDPSCQCWNDE